MATTLAPGQILFDFGNGPEATTMERARNWNISRKKAAYQTRKQNIKDIVAAAVTEAVNNADIAFAMEHADEVASTEDFDQHEANLHRIKRTVARSTYILNGYSECEVTDCTALTTPKANGKTYRWCRTHSGS